MRTDIDCAECGITFGVDSKIIERRREDGDKFYCPNGHANVYRPSRQEARIKQLTREVKAAEDARDRFRKHLNREYGYTGDAIAALRTCPLRCGWRSRKIARRHDGADAYERGLMRVQADTVAHLLDCHDLELPAEAEELLEELAR